ncbi:hypothetical protein Amsp01_074180 [Amycolatopsis sp. NBRC 101858]|nr:hypothetical protein Amsp01_074180 [Amycolatopsis sp. NBRC 101858]
MAKAVTSCAAAVAETCSSPVSAGSSPATMYPLVPTPNAPKASTEILEDEGVDMGESPKRSG